MQVSLLLVAWLQNSMRNSFAPRPSFPVLGIQISSFRSVVELQVVHSLPSYCQSWAVPKSFEMLLEMVLKAAMRLTMVQI